MKLVIGVIGLTVMVFLLGSIAPAHAQEEQHQEQAKPEKQAQQKQKVQQKQRTAQAKQPERTQQTNSSHHAEQKQAAQQSKSAQHAQEQRAQQTERADNNGRGRIPDDRFRAHIGRDHDFRIDRFVMVSGSRRFQYAGYWFGFIDPWPLAGTTPTKFTSTT